MALAGGVYVQATSTFHQVANRAGMLSPEGKCYSFDARANGFVPAEAVGVVALKRLRDALKDGDYIHGVIVGSGVNQNGKSNGLIAPNARAQERLERSVYDRFGINPESIELVEAHATATLLGDSIEYLAISRAFREYTDKKQFCAIGSVKANMGHAGNAAGIVGVLKLLLSLKRRQIPPSLHFQKGNPAIDFESSPFYVNTQLREWEVEGGQARRATISSFGFSGANAHLVIEEAPSIERTTVEAPGYLAPLSARTSGQLKQQARDLLALVKSTPDLSMNDLSFSLFVGRAHLAHRLSCVARNQKELIHLLEQWVETGTASQIYTSEIQEGRMREHGALKRLGNYCIQECRNATNADSYLENLAAIADLFAQGYPLDFHALFSSDSRRIPLPTYPFARERYWVDDAHAAAPRSTAVASTQVDDAEIEVPIEPAWIFTTEPLSAAGDGAAQTVSMGPEEKMALFLKQEAAIQLKRPVDGIPTDLSYFDMGLSSLAITNLVKNANRLLDENLSPRVLFEYSDIQSLAAYLAATYPSRISALTAIRRTGPQAHPGERSHDLANVSWREASLDDGYERLTF